MKTESDGSNIREYYLQKAQELINEYNNPVVLKTDLFNESRIIQNIEPIIPKLTGCKEIYAIEIDEKTYNLASRNLEHLDNVITFLGSICDLPYNDDLFDIIVDLSTLDHVKQSEVDSVLKGYARVLKRGGSFLLFLWVSTKPDANGDVEVSTQQYSYNGEMFINVLSQYFVIEEVGEAMEAHLFGILYRYKCKVKK